MRKGQNAHEHHFARTRLGTAVAVMMGLGSALMAMPAQAFETKVGGADLTINSTVSVGTSVRVEGRDRALYSVTNVDEGGRFGTGLSNTSDDGNLNYDTGDAFSTVIKGLHDFTLKKDNVGFFGRVRWFYDYTLNNDVVFHGHEPTSNNFRGLNNRVPQRLNDNGFAPSARFDNIDMLDAYGFWNTDIGGKALDIRLGKQVISWGESTLILNPISGLNTFDLAALRRPGVNLKEAFLPSEMLYANFGVADNTSVEGFVQLKWRKTALEGCGTYFSTNDFAADGCQRLAFAGPVLFSSTNGALRIGDGNEMNGQAAAAGAASGRNFQVFNRSPDDQPGDGGQYGVAVRHYAPALDVEFGGYFLNYHSRLPLIGLKAGSVAVPATLPLGPGGAQIPSQAANLTPGNALPYALGNANGTYYLSYPKDISTVGFSFSTNLRGIAVAGQVTHSADVPLQYNANDLLQAGLTGTAAVANPNPLQRKVAALKPGERFGGFETFDVTQVQGSMIQQFDRILGASRYVLIGEAAAVFVNGLPEIAPGQRFGRNPVFGSVNGNEGYVTDFSWGYRLRATGTYNNVIGDVDLIPTISWAHDVDGWSPEPGQVFNEGRKVLGLALGFEFNPNTIATISYNTFHNSAKYDPLRDRDFVSLTAQHSF